jgi:plasmid stability protein
MKERCLTIRHCPDRVHKTLLERARSNNRSLNSETLEVLASSLMIQKRLPEAELRERIEALPWQKGLTDEETRKAILEGRK